MKSQQPLVSVIMNCFNGEKYLREAMNSVFSQTLQNWEIIFWDNASSDTSADIAMSFKDSRIKYFLSSSNTSLGEARRNAVNVARGKWIAFLDCDDIWYNNKLAVQINALEGTEYVFTYAGIREITAQGKKIRSILPKYESGDLLGNLLTQFDVNMVTPVVRRRFLLDNEINFEPEITASEEYNLFVRLAARGEVLVQKRILGDYRVYPGSLTDQKISRWAIERRLTLKQLCAEVPSVPKALPGPYREAEMRADYYEARYLVSLGCHKQARNIMNRIGVSNLKYRLLGIALYIPGLWSLIHQKIIRRKLVTLLHR